MNSVIPKVYVYNEKLVAAVVTRCQFSPICITYRKLVNERSELILRLTNRLFRNRIYIYVDEQRILIFIRNIWRGVLKFK